MFMMSQFSIKNRDLKGQRNHELLQQAPSATTGSTRLSQPRSSASVRIMCSFSPALVEILLARVFWIVKGSSEISHSSTGPCRCRRRSPPVQNCPPLRQPPKHFASRQQFENESSSGHRDSPQFEGGNSLAATNVGRHRVPPPHRHTHHAPTPPGINDGNSPEFRSRRWHERRSDGEESQSGDDLHGCFFLFDCLDDTQ